MGLILWVLYHGSYIMDLVDFGQDYNTKVEK